MKIVSWNINGMRSALSKGFIDWFRKTDPDVLNLQEIRSEWLEIDAGARAELESKHEVCWFPAGTKKGYAGTATLSRRGLGFTHTRGLGLKDVDVEGRFVESRHAGFTLLAGYFPNASSELERLPFKRKFSKDFAKILRARRALGENLVVVGDMNVAPEEIDLANPKTNKRSAGFTDEEREDFRAYLAEGLTDVFRQRHPTDKGMYTWWSQRAGARGRNIGWRIDIFLVSQGLVERVTEVKIHPEVLGSDHCPVSLEIDV